MSKSSLRALACAASAAILISSPSFASEPLQVVVTADRTDVPLKNTGSAITVITSDEIDKFGSKNLTDILRSVPGLTVAETGGLGSETKVQLRGASPGASMILLDGIRVSDPSNTEGYFDFGNFSAANIERIEILRGPQSALYGSDAMGGVINIITKKGKRTPVREVNVEAGSYGTYSTRGSIAGGTDSVSYAFGVNALHSDGFPRYGYRIDHPILVGDENLNNLLPALPANDPVDKMGLSGNVKYQLDNNVSIELGISSFGSYLQFDNTSDEDPFSTNNRSKSQITNWFTRAKFDALDGKLKNQVTVYDISTDRTVYEDFKKSRNYENYDPINNPLEYYAPYVARSTYSGDRYGVEYQGDMNLKWAGNLTFGTRGEVEDAKGKSMFSSFNGQQSTGSLFLQDRLAFTDHFDVTIGGRVDSVSEGQTFLTWRSTAAYRIDETKTKLRASIGTGAKAPSLYQRFSSSGQVGLEAERSDGYEVGFDQSLFDENVTFSATYFKTDYRNRIGYLDTCGPNPTGYPYGCYYNIGFVASNGYELAVDTSLIPENLSARLSYTHLSAIDKSQDSTDIDLGLQIYRTPKDQLSLSLLYTGVSKFEFEPRITWVGSRLDKFFYQDGVAEFYDPVWDYYYYGANFVAKNVTLPSYLKLDFLTRYKINNSNDAYIRLENLTDAQTSDVYNYGSAGRSIYVGLTTRW